MPTSEFAEDGQTTDPSVSVPIAARHRFAAAAAPEPELDPHGFLSSAYGLRVCPPLPLHPLVDFVDLKFAHSLRFVLPSITAPARLSRSATKESLDGIDPASASEPAVVIM